MEIAQLVMSPTLLLDAFIFFWREAKAGRQELRNEWRSDFSQLEARLVTRMDRMEDRLETRIARLEEILIKQSKTG